MNVRHILFLISVLLLAGCGFTDQYHQEYDDLGKKVAAEFKELPGVAKAEYTYIHGIDQGQGVSVSATLSKEANEAEMPQKLMEIAQRNYWLSIKPTGGLAMSVRVWSADPSRPEISLKQVDINDTAELERKYGPRPTAK